MPNASTASDEAIDAGGGHQGSARDAAVCEVVGEGACDKVKSKGDIEFETQMAMAQLATALVPVIKGGNSTSVPLTPSPGAPYSRAVHLTTCRC